MNLKSRFNALIKMGFILNMKEFYMNCELKSLKIVTIYES